MGLLLNSWLAELGVVLITCLTGLYLYFQWKYQHWKRKGLPYLEPKFPFGNLQHLVINRKTFGDTIADLYWRLDGHKVGGVYQMDRPSLLVRDPELIKTILIKDFAHFHDHGINFDEKTDPLSGHLFALEGKKWKHLRHKLTPTFTSGKMKMMFPTLVACGEELKDHLAPIAGKQQIVEIKDVLGRYTTDIIATCAFGIESNCMKHPDSEFRVYGKKAFNPSPIGLIRETISLLSPELAKSLKIPAIARDVSAFFMKIVRETLEYREKFNVTRNDFLQQLINIKNKRSDQDADDVAEEVLNEKNMFDVRGMTMEELAAQVFVFFIAGFETSSSTMSFCLYELSLNKKVQENLMEEIDRVLKKHGGELTYEAIMSMDYLDRVIAETLRKYPPVPALLRVCTKDYRLPDPDIEISKGTAVIISASALHHDPQHYPDPETFDPERFTQEGKATRHQCVYLPFGEGPRVCIGSRFGLMQVKVGLVSVLSTYSVDLCRELTPVPLVMDVKSFILSSKDGINLKLSSRKKVT